MVWASNLRQTDGWVTCIYDSRLEGDLRWWSYAWTSPLPNEMKYLLRRSCSVCLMPFDLNEKSVLWCIFSDSVARLTTKHAWNNNSKTFIFSWFIHFFLFNTILSKMTQVFVPQLDLYLAFSLTFSKPSHTPVWCDCDFTFTTVLTQSG